MKIKCDYCGNTYEEYSEKCPYCGAPNPSHHDGDRQPRTIEELKQWYLARKLPPQEITRFFIGIDYKKPKAFGIYKDEDGNFVVYKNKADGSRAIRYKGKDEAYAVDELYQKLKDEIVNQRQHQKKSTYTVNASDRVTGSRGNPRKSVRVFRLVRSIVAFYAIVILLISVAKVFFPHKPGYYKYDGNTYYRYGSNSWYVYDDYSDTWYDTDEIGYEIPVDLDNADSKSDYYAGSKWDSSISATNWQDTEYCEEIQAQESSRSSWDSDSSYDWDSNDSWDSGDTDWDSDW